MPFHWTAPGVPSNGASTGEFDGNAEVNALHRSELASVDREGAFRPSVSFRVSDVPRSYWQPPSILSMRNGGPIWWTGRSSGRSRGYPAVANSSGALSGPMTKHLWCEVETREQRETFAG